MKIAILGWGSLIWQKDSLPLATKWSTGGPKIPVEFSRISKSRGGSLTLVIDPINGELVTTLYAISKRTDLQDTICDLRIREDTVVKRIGFVDLVDGNQRCNIYPEASNSIRSWASKVEIDAVVWTDLPSNFEEKTSKQYSIELAIEYLHNLSQLSATKAREYILNTPPEISTPLRRALINDKWMKG